MRRNVLRSINFVLALAVGAGACNGTVDPGAATTNNVELLLVGADNVQLFDAQSKPKSNDIVSAIVTVTEIDARVAHAWQPLVTTSSTIDLLKLDNVALNTLGITTLPAGHIDELRFKLDNIGAYVVLASGDKKPLEVPDNGYVKIVGTLDLDACASGIVILDFDPSIKIEHEHDQREYELSCVARIKTEEMKGSCGAGGGGGSGGGGGPDMGGGQSCSAGQVCPMGQTCQAGVCVVTDPCAGVICPMGQTCTNGTCH